MSPAGRCRPTLPWRWWFMCCAPSQLPARPTPDDGSMVRFGVVGTGFWAREVHGAGVKATQGAELAGVWGRDREKTRDAADALGAAAFDDFDLMLDAVDAVT